MSYCGPRALPHSVFLSWDPLDQDKAKAWIIEENSKCRQCGTKPSDWLDEKGREKEFPPFEAITQLCVGCQAVQDKGKSVPQDRQGFVRILLKRVTRSR